MTDQLMNSDQPISCAHVESLASEWVDGTLAPDVRLDVESHLDACGPCADLVADLAGVASEARALPRLEPSRDLWAGIAERIGTPVVVLEPRRVTAAPARRWWTSAVAAAALVAVTAGVTWRMAVDSVQRDTVAAGARVPAATPETPGTGVAPVTVAAAAPDSGPASIAAAVTPAVTPVATRGPRAAGSAGAARQAVASGRRTTPAATAVAAAAPLPAAAQAYDREITGMRALVTERRKDLDPSTVRVLERNLRIIDQAIAESRAALTQDPASGLLAEQLTRAMKRKLELLRTAADLPARTS